MDGLWVIWSIEHNAWWKHDSDGYTRDRQQAGKYTLEVARDIVNQANIVRCDVPSVAMIPDY
jgi:hypothetical protein